MTTTALYAVDAPCAETLATRFSLLGYLASLGGIRQRPGCAVLRRGEEGYEVAVTREVILPGDAATAFAFVAAEDVLPKVLTGYGPLPAAIGTADLTGPWTVPGSSRTVRLADGGSAHEQLTHYDFGRHFAYKVSRFRNPARFLASHARGEWVFTPVAGGTHVVWTYTFVALGGYTALPLVAMMQLLWRGYMDVCLDNCVKALSSTAL